MFREKSELYHVKEPGKGYANATLRPKKTAEEAQQLRWKISMIKLFLRNASRLNFTDAQIEAKKSELQRLERKLDALSEPRSHKIKKSYKKLPPAKIKAYVLEQINKAKENGQNFIMAEDIANQLQVKVHHVKQVLQQLNVEGILRQPVHRIPHDSNRDPWNRGFYSGWESDIYYFRNRDDE